MTRVSEIFGVVIVNWNTCLFLKYCIESYLSAGVVEENIVVVDNGSIDCSIEMVRAKFPNVKIVSIPENHGYANAANRGAILLTTELIVISNADIIVNRDTLQNILNKFEIDSSVGLVGARHYDAFGNERTRYTRTSVTRAILLELFPNLFRGLKGKFERHQRREQDAVETSFVEGAFMVVQRSVFESVVGFDEGFGFFAEDADLTYRIRAAGYRAIILRTALVIHTGGASFSQNKERYLSEYYKSMILFYSRHSLRRAVWLYRFLLLIFYVKCFFNNQYYNVIKSVRNLKNPLSKFNESEILISIVIPTYERVDCLIKLLEQLEKQTFKNFEVIVVDQSNKCDDRKEIAFKEFKGNLRVIRTSSKGRSVAKNVGMREAKGDIILFCDDDIVPRDDFLQVHLRNHRDPTIGGVSCRTIEPYSKELNTKNICRITLWGQMIGGIQSDVKTEVETLVGENMSFKRDSLLRAGYFDASYQGTSIFEEQDVSFRIKYFKYKRIFTNETSVDHNPQPMGNDDIKLKHRIEYYRDFHHNELLYFLKNRNRLCLLFVIPFCFLRSIKQTIIAKELIWGVFKIFSGVFDGIKTYYSLIKSK